MFLEPELKGESKQKKITVSPKKEVTNACYVIQSIENVD
jgi:hypothetical protein